jgi:hypothetical protein
VAILERGFGQSETRHGWLGYRKRMIDQRGNDVWIGVACGDVDLTH